MPSAPPDGRVFATGSDDGVVRLWRHDSLEPVWELGGPEGDNLWDIAFLSNGRQLVASDRSGSARLISALTGDSITSFGFQTVRSLEPVADGPLVVWASVWRGVFLWDAATHTDLGTIGIGSYIFGAAVSSNGRWTAAVSREGYVRLWDIASRTQLWTFRRGPTDAWYQVGFSVDDAWVFVAGRDRQLLVLDSGSGTLVRTLDTGVGIRAMAVDPSGQLVATVGRGVIRLWDARTLEPVSSIEEGVGDQIEGVSFSEDGSTLGTTDRDGVVIWDVESLRRAFPPTPIPSPTTLPIREVPDCGGGEAFEVRGVIVDSLTGLPVDSVTVRTEGCALVTDAGGRFAFGGLSTSDSLQVSLSKEGYRPREPRVSAEAAQDARLLLARRARCHGTGDAPLPRVETVDSAVVLRLTPPMQTVLDSIAPGFRPQPLNNFTFQHERFYDYACYQAPSAVLGDFNGDAQPDLLAHGRSGGDGFGVMLVSDSDGYVALLRDGLLPSTNVLTRVEPGIYSGSIEDEPPLTIQTQGVRQSGEMYVNRIIYYLDGELHVWDYPFL